MLKMSSGQTMCGHHLLSFKTDLPGFSFLPAHLLFFLLLLCLILEKSSVSLSPWKLLVEAYAGSSRPPPLTRVAQWWQFCLRIVNCSGMNAKSDRNVLLSALKSHRERAVYGDWGYVCVIVKKNVGFEQRRANITLGKSCHYVAF